MLHRAAVELLGTTAKPRAAGRRKSTICTAPHTARGGGGGSEAESAESAESSQRSRAKPPGQLRLDRGQRHNAGTKPHKERRARAEARETTKHANRDTQYATRLLGNFVAVSYSLFSSKAHRYQVRYSLATILEIYPKTIAQIRT
jgi:hypothetical protein